MSKHAVRSRSWIVPMRPRSRDEVHRAATPFELFFDLVFVVAVAQAAVGVGLAVAVDQATHHAEIGSSEAGAAVTIPVAIYLICL